MALTFCRGRTVCVHCPDNRHQPPFKPFALALHKREHLQRNPGHHIVWWCFDHQAWDCTRKVVPVTSGGRGGRRPGAGAPKGNANRLRHGRRSQRDDLRDLLATLPSDVRISLLPWLREAAPRMRSIKRRLAWLEPPPDTILPFRPTALPSQQQQHDVQSNPALDALIVRTTAWGFLGATSFVRRHSPAAAVIETILDYFDQGGADHLRNPAGLLRQLLHDEIAAQVGPLLTCPYCPWTTPARKERSS